MLGEEEKESKGKKKYLGRKFQTNMDNLTKVLRYCIRYYIRYLKPNGLKKKFFYSLV
jgi:myosin heavy subunit